VRDLASAGVGWGLALGWLGIIPRQGTMSTYNYVWNGTHINMSRWKVTHPGND